MRPVSVYFTIWQGLPGVEVQTASSGVGSGISMVICVPLMAVMVRSKKGPLLGLHASVPRNVESICIAVIHGVVQGRLMRTPLPTAKPLADETLNVLEPRGT